MMTGFRLTTCRNDEGGNDVNHTGRFLLGCCRNVKGRGHGPLLRQDGMLRGMEFYINGMPECDWIPANDMPE